MIKIYEKEFENGIIESKGRPICKVRRIQVTKSLPNFDNGKQRIFMTKSYQNNDEKEHAEIDDDLIQIFDNNEKFTVTCYGNEGQIYICIFREKPPKGQGILSAEIL